MSEIAEIAEKIYVPFTCEGLKTYFDKILSKIYERENYEIEGNENSNTITTTIYFPHVHITNSVGNEYDSDDIYLRFIFKYKDSQIKLTNTCAAKTTIQMKDIIYNNSFVSFYIHSHINSSSECWKMNNLGFCFGSGNYIRTLKDNLERYNYENILRLSKFFYAINEFLQWESLEGVPFVSMASLDSSRLYYKKRPVYIDNNDIKHMAYEVMREMKGFRFVITEDKAQITDLYSIVEEILLKNENYKKYRVRTIDGVAIGRERVKVKNLISSIPEFASFKFKGEYPKMNIKKESGKDFRRNHPLKIDSLIISRVVSYIEEKFMYYLSLTYRNY